jgi:putative acetyltransferase
MSYVRPEIPSDHAPIHKLTASAFADSKLGHNGEADLIDVLRKSCKEFLSLVAVAKDENEVVGHILFTQAESISETSRIVGMGLAPMAVAPSHQRQGIGSSLIKSGITMLADRGCPFVVVLGHPDFYPRFGFSAELAQPLDSPFGGGEAWMAMELVPGALEGVVGRVEYPPPFGQFE